MTKIVTWTTNQKYFVKKTHKHQYYPYIACNCFRSQKQNVGCLLFIQIRVNVSCWLYVGISFRLYFNWCFYKRNSFLCPCLSLIQQFSVRLYQSVMVSWRSYIYVLLRAIVIKFSFFLFFALSLLYI